MKMCYMNLWCWGGVGGGSDGGGSSIVVKGKGEGKERREKK